ncbi:hypothetical protein [Halocola ammonii]
MRLERKDDEILIRLSSDIDLKELQNLLDYLEYQESSYKSKAKQSDADSLAEEVNKSIWYNFQSKR